MYLLSLKSQESYLPSFKMKEFDKENAMIT